jgi:hypothetical protein
MTSSRTGSILGVLCLVAACAGTGSQMTPAERLEFYRAHSGEPVRSFHHSGTLWGWRSIGDSALTVWTSGNRGYLLELSSRCSELPFAKAIGLTNRTGRVSAGFDSVVIVDRANARRIRTSCRIDTIRPVDTRFVEEPKSELQDVESVERDPSVPDEPQ